MLVMLTMIGTFPELRIFGSPWWGNRTIWQRQRP